MPPLNRRHLLQNGAAIVIPVGLQTLITGCDTSSSETSPQAESSPDMNHRSQQPEEAEQGEPMKVQYLEIVTPDVEGLCRQYSSLYDTTFSEPDPSLGGARTAPLNGGGLLGIRGPLRETETPVVRPYLLVADISAAVESAAEAGAEIAMPPTSIPGHGMFAIVIHGGIECGFWQN